MVLCQGAGGGVRGAGVGGREGVLCWDEALYPHIFLWEWESGERCGFAAFSGFLSSGA